MHDSIINSIFNEKGTDKTNDIYLNGVSGVILDTDIKKFASEQYGKLVLPELNKGIKVDTVFILNDGKNSKISYHLNDTDNEMFLTPINIINCGLKDFEDFFEDKDFLLAIDFKGNIARFEIADSDLYPPLFPKELYMGELYSRAKRIKSRNFSQNEVVVDNVFNQVNPLSAIYPEGIPESK